MGMNYERIHTCPNDCILYKKNYEGLERYPIYEVDRCKKNKNKIPAKVLWYFSVIPRFNACLRTQNMRRV